MLQMLKERVGSTLFDLPHNELNFTPKRGFSTTPYLFSEVVDEVYRNVNKEFWLVDLDIKSHCWF